MVPQFPVILMYVLEFFNIIYQYNNSRSCFNAAMTTPSIQHNRIQGIWEDTIENGKKHKDRTNGMDKLLTKFELRSVTSMTLV